jgi:hypothetical protein
MIDKLLKLALIILALHISNTAQNGPRFTFLPGGLSFMPLKANNQEARLGVLYYTSTTNLKVDIGNAVDLLSIQFDDSKSLMAAGIEFMAYAFSKSYAGKRLQISAVDGFFGGNISFSRHFEQNKLLARFRIIHNSAHLVDGNFDTDNNIWIDGKSPIPFTKDFGEITIAHQVYYYALILKYYGGLSYASLIRPEELKRSNYHFGFELALKNVLGKIFEHDTNIFLAEHFFLDGTTKYFGNQQLLAGIKFGDWDKKGIVLYASYYSGRDMFSSFYDKKINKFGIGFSIDFF